MYLSQEVIDSIPKEACGLMLEKDTGAEELVICEPVMFERKYDGVISTLNRACLAGKIFPASEVRPSVKGDFWVTVQGEDFTDLCEIRLDKRSWNSLKNKWMRCKVCRY